MDLTSNSSRRQTWIWVGVTLGIYWLTLIHQLGAQWSVYEQYSYGWAVPFLCVYLVWQRVQLADCGLRIAEIPRLPSAGFYFLIALCALLYAPTRFFHEANPIWRLTSLLWTLEVIVITLVLLRFILRTSSLVFPVCFFLVAVPWPSGIEAFLVQTLTHLNVSGTVEIVGWLGIPALQHDNVIEVATGDVGVNEACSGIRSFQATLMIALFAGEFYRLNTARRAICVFAGFAFSFLFNMARTTLLTWVAAKRSVAAVASWHDPAGIVILVGCFVTLWLVARWLGRQRESKAETGKLKPESQPSAESPPSQSTQSSSLALTRLALVLLVWLVLVEGGVQWWYRAHETSAVVNSQWSVNPAALGPGFVPIEIPSEIKSQFHADENLEGRWQDDLGNVWQLYYFRWTPARSLEKRVAIQLAKTHGPEKCLPAIGMLLKSDCGVVTLSVGRRQFAFREYLFLSDDRPLFVFYAIYEDPTGSGVLANRRQDTASRIAAALAGSRNDGQRFLEFAVAGPQNPEQAQTVLSMELGKLISTKL